MVSEHFEELTEPQRRGDATEAIVRMAFVVRGVTVLEPVGDNEPYDIVVDRNGEFSRIQVKTAYDGPNGGSVRFETRTTRVKSSGYEPGRYDGRIEFFAVFSPETGDIYLVPVEDAQKDAMTIRYRTAKNNNTSQINWHADYLLDEPLHLL